MSKHIQDLNVIRVEKWEHDRWSGPSLLERVEFRGNERQQEADTYCTEVNAQNTEDHAPEYYIEAHIVS